MGAGLASGYLVAEDFGRELPTHTFRLRRDQDLLDLEIRFINFELRAGRPGEPKLSLAALGSGRSLVAVRFPPQNLAEAIFEEVHKDPNFENDPLKNYQGNRPEPPVPSYLSGPSQVVFDVPDGTVFNCGPSVGGRSTIEEWFQQFSRFDLQIPAGASRPMPPVAPRSDETCLEIPFRLYISPVSARTGWHTSKGPGDGNSELWHASLRSREPLTPSGLPPGFVVPPDLKAALEPPKRVVLQARAVYSPDYRRKGQPPFSLYYPSDQPLSLHALTRHRLVKQMSEGDGWIDAERMILSALGAHASLYYASRKKIDTIIEQQLQDEDGEAGTELRLWKHRIVVGRDVFFAEAFFGFLFPFIVPSVYVEITQRKFAARELRPRGVFSSREYGPPGDYLLKRRLILVQDPAKQFTDSGSALGRSMPLKKIALKTLRSPDLADPNDSPPGLYDITSEDKKKLGNLVFWPTDLVTGKRVEWEFESADESRQTCTTRGVFLFADHIKAGHLVYAREPQNVKPAPLTTAERTIPFPGSKIAYAPEEPLLKLEGASPVQTVLHVMTSVERAGATLLGNAARECLKLGLSAKETAERIIRNLKELAKQLPQPNLDEEFRSLVGKVSALRKETFDAAATAVEKAQKWFATGAEQIRAITSVADQLTNAEKVAATLETHAMTFVSGFARPLFEAARTLTDKLATLDEFKKELLNFPADVKDKVTKETQALIDAAGGKWDEAKRTVKTYLDEIAAAEKSAKDLGAHIFHTVVEKAQAVIPAIKAVVPDAAIKTIHLFEDYVAGGIAAVQKGVYAKLAEVATEGNKLADQIKNGIAKPAGVIAGLARDIGAVVADGESQLKDIARKLKDTIDIGNAIPDAKLFGVLPLRQILQQLARGQLPDINLVELPDRIERRWEWVAPVQRKDFGIIELLVPDPATTRLWIRFTTIIELPKPQALVGGTPPSGSIQLDGHLGAWDELKKEPIDPAGGFAFSLKILGLVEVQFRRLSLEAKYRTGESVKPNIKPDLKGVEFLGPLRFLSTLQEALKSLGSGFRLDISPQAIKVGFGLSIPPLSFGVFTLQGIEIGSNLALSLTDRPLRFDFNFSSHAKPFELSVMGFAGRGFFRAALDSSGAKELEGAFEFGGSLSFNIAVASGGLFVVAGAYFKITNEATEFAGYLRAGGNLSVLGLIHANVEFLLMIRYRRQGSENQLQGICRITVSISLFMFSIDVSLEMEKVIAGSASRGDQPVLALGEAAGAGPALGNGMPYADRKNLAGRFRDHKNWNRSYWAHLQR